MQAEQLVEKLNQYPRVNLAQYPTPMEYLPRISADLGRPVYIKRDDQIGPGMGGNKTRKLEYLMADAVQRGARKVVTFGGLQSNHARITAAAARMLGMDPHLFYFERRPDKLTGNLLVNDLLGARMHFIPLGSGGGMTLEAACLLVHLIAWARLGPHYFIPVGGHSWRGCLGYVRAALEIDEQARSLGIEQAWLVTAAGSGGTLAGLMSGLALTCSRLGLVGIDVGKLWKAFPVSIGRLAGGLCARFGEPQRFPSSRVPLVEGRYVGQAYALPTPACQEAVKRLARMEGILLDPVYTGKAFAGLLDMAARGMLGRREPVIFLHTGGAPALFA